MKIFLFLSLFTMNIFAANKTTAVQKVRSIDFDKNEASVTFWNNNKVFRLPAGAKVMPCLENGLKAEMEVYLEFVKNTDAIANCKLYTDGK